MQNNAHSPMHKQFNLQYRFMFVKTASKLQGQPVRAYSRRCIFHHQPLQQPLYNPLSPGQ